ncbi:PDZ domain-containing protein [Thalassoglobus polymorphus]|uniref:Zinc metallopeptidase RseP n=1 Tax=Thalassoglobus polymorphus TaxID=2527994 RepID=A0A517QPW6_9PLAN|nr:PDZ domain-containing protein [Thalassoglobus polymorphus]QDT33647.1 zinc metallopeptidase RseP [Thalassoglobus polymorphus]
MIKTSTWLSGTVSLALIVAASLYASLSMAQDGQPPAKPKAADADAEQGEEGQRRTIIRKEIIFIGPNGTEHRIPMGNPVTIPHGLPSYKTPEESQKILEKQFFIGVTLESIPEGYHGLIGISDNEGLLISKVLEKSPASEAGIQRFDLLFKLNGESISSPIDFKEEVRKNKGKQLTLSIRRKQELLDITVTPKAWAQMNDDFRKLFLQEPLSLPLEGLQNPLPAPQSYPGMLWGPAKPQNNALQSDIHKLREEFQAHQKLMLKKLEDLQAELKKK